MTVVSLLASVLLAVPPFVVGAPSVVLDIDASALRGSPVQLGWSPDSRSCYLETLEGSGPDAKRHFFMIDGTHAPTEMNAEPAWADGYWQFKSNRVAPGHAEILIQVQRTSDDPIAARPDREAAVDAANDTAAAGEKLTVEGRVISELVDEPLVPGMTFGWAPKVYDAIAYRNERRHGLSIYRIGGGHMDVHGTRDVLLPAWSPDGTRIVFLERVGKTRYELDQVRVSLP